MAYKIKPGSMITPYGESCQSFDENSALSQPILEWLATRYPDDISDPEAEAQAAADAEAQAAAKAKK